MLPQTCVFASVCFLCFLWWLASMSVSTHGCQIVSSLVRRKVCVWVQAGIQRMSGHCLHIFVCAFLCFFHFLSICWLVPGHNSLSEWCLACTVLVLNEHIRVRMLSHVCMSQRKGHQRPLSNHLPSTINYQPNWKVLHFSGHYLGWLVLLAFYPRLQRPGDIHSC